MELGRVSQKSSLPPSLEKDVDNNFVNRKTDAMANVFMHKWDTNLG